MGQVSRIHIPLLIVHMIKWILDDDEQATQTPKHGHGQSL